VLVSRGLRVARVCPIFEYSAPRLGSHAFSSNKSFFDAVAAFKKLDLDGNGSIDLDEMKAAVEKAGLTEAFPADKCEALFKAIDTNGDGEIDEEEFKAGCAASDEAQLGLLQKIVDAC